MKEEATRYQKNYDCSLTGMYCYISDDLTDRYVDCRNCNVPIIHFFGGEKLGKP